MYIRKTCVFAVKNITLIWRKKRKEREKKMHLALTQEMYVIGTEYKVQLGLQDFQEISTDMPTKYCSPRAEGLWLHASGTE
jgi:hypothetical protein